MIKRIISLVFIAVAFSTFTMEKPTSKPSYLEPLITELKIQIALHLTTAKTIDEAVKNIRSLRQVNKEFYDLLNDPVLTKWIIEELAKKYASSLLEVPKDPYAQRNFEVKENAKLIVVAAALNTTAAIQWLQNYLKDPKNREAAEYVLVQMATKNVNIVDGLLKAGLNPNSHSKYYGFTPPQTTALRAAANKNYLPGIKRLLAAGADPNLQTGPFSPLASAIINNAHPDIIKTLLDAGARIQSDALHLAAATSNDQVVIPTMTLLLNAGVRINQLNDAKRTALDNAIDIGKNQKIIWFLRSHGAKRASELP